MMLRTAVAALALAGLGVSAASAQTAEKAATPAPAATKAPASTADKLAAGILAETAKAKPAAPAAAANTTTTAAAKPATTQTTAKPTTTVATAATATTTAKATPVAAKTATKPAAKKAKPKPKTIEDMAVEGQVSWTMAAMAEWISSSKDNRKMPYAVVDKTGMQILVFDATGKLKGMSPILIGAAVGDTSVEGVGDRELKDIPMEDRTTPAGRFVAGYGPATGHSKVLWIDYETAISIHPVLTTPAAKKEKRTQRLASEQTDDNRITHGCINVSATFYANTIRSTFGKKGGVFYVIPDSISLLDAFPAYYPPGAEPIAALEEPAPKPAAKPSVKTAAAKPAAKPPAAQPKETTATVKQTAPAKSTAQTATKTALE